MMNKIDFTRRPLRVEQSSLEHCHILSIESKTVAKSVKQEAEGDN